LESSQPHFIGDSWNTSEKSVGIARIASFLLPFLKT
jgi:hypothetical protein